MVVHQKSQNKQQLFLFLLHIQLSEFICREFYNYLILFIHRNEPITPFCNYLNSPSITQVGCTVDRAAKSYCNLRDYGFEIPTEYQV